MPLVWICTSVTTASGIVLSVLAVVLDRFALVDILLAVDDLCVIVLCGSLLTASVMLWWKAREHAEMHPHLTKVATKISRDLFLGLFGPAVFGLVSFPMEVVHMYVLERERRRFLSHSVSHADSPVPETDVRHAGHGALVMDFLLLAFLLFWMSTVRRKVSSLSVRLRLSVSQHVRSSEVLVIQPQTPLQGEEPRQEDQGQASQTLHHQ